MIQTITYTIEEIFVPFALTHTLLGVCNSMWLYKFYLYHSFFSGKELIPNVNLRINFHTKWENRPNETELCLCDLDCAAAMTWRERTGWKSWRKLCKINALSVISLFGVVWCLPMFCMHSDRTAFFFCWCCWAWRRLKGKLISINATFNTNKRQNQQNAWEQQSIGWLVLSITEGIQTDIQETR